MKTLSQYKSEFKRRKTTKGRLSVFNKAMLNLNYWDQQKFIKWQNSIHAYDREDNKF